MSFAHLRIVACAMSAAVLLLIPVSARAQNGEAKPVEPRGQASEKDPKKVDEFAEAARLLGGPAANPECMWLGRRAVGLLFRDDLDTAFRHLDLYDRFGCPSAHVQAAFRCLVKQGNPDPKVEKLEGRAHACWINPTGDTSAAPSASMPSGTTAR